MNAQLALREETVNGFEWLQVESMRLMDENAAPDEGICGNEWFVVGELRGAEEAGRGTEMLRVLRNCACPEMAELADSMITH